MATISEKKLKKLVDKKLFEWLAPLGFVMTENGGCERWQNGVYTYIACIVDRLGGVNRIKPFGQMGFLQIQKIYSHFMSDDPAESNKIAVDLQANYANFMRDWTAYIPCQNEEDVDTMQVKLKAFIFDKLYPTLTRYATPEQVLALYLKYDETKKPNFDLPVFHGHSSALGALIIARLHAPQYYEKLKKRYQPVIAELMFPDEIQRCANLIAYLDQKELTPI